MTGHHRIVADGLTRVFGRRYAVRDVSFDWKPGAVTAVVGANGAGKSTVLGIVAGRLAASQGSVRYGEAQEESPPRNAMGFLSHASFLYRGLTCRENLQLVSELHRLTGPSRVDDVLQRVGLKDHGNRLVSELSRGMVQRLAIGRVLLPNPGILLLDEPTTGLDDGGRRWLAETLQSLAAEERTVVVVSHHRTFLTGMAQHALVLRRGRSMFQGEASEAGGWDALFREYIET